MLLVAVACLLDRFWFRRTPEQRLTAAIRKSNNIATEQIRVQQMQYDNQQQLLTLMGQTPEIVAAVAAAVNGSIGARVGLGKQSPGYGGTSRY